MSKISLQIPTDRSAISILGMHENTHGNAEGDQFVKDGWVYDKDGNQKRKWFITIGKHQVRIWEPKLKDLTGIEKLRWRIVEHLRNVLVPQWNAAHKQMLAAGKGHLQAWTTWDNQRVLLWREYTANEMGVSWSWLDPGQEPEVSLNQESAESYQFAENRMRQYFQYLGKVDEVLFRAIEDRLSYPKKYQDAGKRIKVVINSREYWLCTVYHGAALVWERLSWPEITPDEVIQINV
jgi:hypothetical protein